MKVAAYFLVWMFVNIALCILWGWLGLTDIESFLFGLMHGGVTQIILFWFATRSAFK